MCSIKLCLFHSQVEGKLVWVHAKRLTVDFFFNQTSMLARNKTDEHRADADSQTRLFRFQQKPHPQTLRCLTAFHFFFPPKSVQSFAACIRWASSVLIIPTPVICCQWFHSGGESRDMMSYCQRWVLKSRMFHGHLFRCVTVGWRQWEGRTQNANSGLQKWKWFVEFEKKMLSYLQSFVSMTVFCKSTKAFCRRFDSIQLFQVCVSLTSFFNCQIKVFHNSMCNGNTATASWHPGFTSRATCESTETTEGKRKFAS